VTKKIGETTFKCSLGAGKEKVIFKWSFAMQSAYEQDRNRLPKEGDTYWTTVAATLSRKICSLKVAYEVVWYPKKYRPVHDANPRGSEGSKKNLVFFDYPGEVKSYFSCLSGMQELYDKIMAVAKGYEIISRTHQSILSFMRSELSMIPGGGNLNTVV